jgi:hypothetical protein
VKPLPETLLDQAGLWRARHGNRRMSTIATGYPELDAHLPGGGWPLGALTELIVDRYGIGELRLFLPALCGLSHKSDRWLMWVAPPHEPYAPALAAAGLNLSRHLVARPDQRRDILWAAEHGLRSGCCAAVLLWTEYLSGREARRLQLAAESSKAWALVFRPPAALGDHSPAALRLKIGVDHGERRLHVLKTRGGHPTVLNGLQWLIH